ncbi:hypothetical protein BU17DRAFT_47043 [Hysterangium stoloniferum]|nr:hypothetical protein BU17DRAFT_47043 [Hysterangium stoloniferum]
MPPNIEDLEPPPPPLNHVLKPHHIGLLAVILLAYRRDASPSPFFMLHIQRILIEEVSETALPRPYDMLVQELTYSASIEALSLNKALRLVVSCSSPINTYDYILHQPKHLNGIDSMHDFFSVEKDEEERHSYFGLFCRRCCISYYKLSFAGIDRLREDFLKWAQGEYSSGYNLQENKRKGNGHLLFPTAGDEKDYGSAESFAAFQKATAEGDISEAVESLRTFFDQHFSDANESGVRQHALLNLAIFHYNNCELAVARKVMSKLLMFSFLHLHSFVQYLLEAITVARTSSDKVTLQHCMSLLRRLSPHEGSPALPLTEIHANASAIHIVSDVLKLLVQTKEPVISLFSRVMQSWGCYDKSCSPTGGPPAEHEQWAIHAVQAFIWKISGPESLARPEEDIVLTFTERLSSNEARWDAFRSRAERHARQGRVTEALAVLLDPECWSNLNLRLYNDWACAVWRVLANQVKRRGQIRLLHEYYRDQIPFLRMETLEMFTRSLPPPKGQCLSPLLDRDAILHAKHHYKWHNTLATVQPLLRGLFAAEFRGHWSMYRIGIVLLADLTIDLEMRKYGRRILEEIMPQIMPGDDIELRAFACYVLARCIVNSANGQMTAISAAIPYLAIAEEDYGTLEMLSCQQDVLYFMASIFNTLGMQQDRDSAAARHARSVQISQAWTQAEVPTEAIEICSIITEVGARIAVEAVSS